MRIGMFGGSINEGTIDDVVAGNPDEAAATRQAIKDAMA